METEEFDPDVTDSKYPDFIKRVPVIIRALRVVQLDSCPDDFFDVHHMVNGYVDTLEGKITLVEKSKMFIDSYMNDEEYFDPNNLQLCKDALEALDRIRAGLS